MQIRLDWIERAVLVIAIPFLLPLAIHLIAIVARFLDDLWTFGL